MKARLEPILLVSALAILIAVGALAAAIFLFLGNSDDSPSGVAQAAPAPATAEPVAAGDGAESAQDLRCQLKITSARLSRAPVTGFDSVFGSVGIVGTAIAPAVEENDEFSFEVRTASGIDCATSRGVIGLRGGVRLSVGDRAMELRRFRIDVGDQQLKVFARSVGPGGVNAISADLSGADRIDAGEQITIAAPLQMSASGVISMNSALGVQLIPQSLTLGTLTLVGEKVRT